LKFQVVRGEACGEPAVPKGKAIIVNNTKPALHDSPAYFPQQAELVMPPMLPEFRWHDNRQVSGAAEFGIGKCLQDPDINAPTRSLALRFPDSGGRRRLLCRKGAVGMEAALPHKRTRLVPMPNIA
jgi:hypothetical protein